MKRSTILRVVWCFMEIALVSFSVFLNDFVNEREDKHENSYFLLFILRAIHFHQFPSISKKKKKTILYNLHQSPLPPPPPLWKSTKNTFPLRTPISARAREKEKKETPLPPFFLLKFHNPSINLLSSILFAYHVTQFRQQRIYLVPEKKTLRHPRRNRNSQPLMDPINGASI